MAALDDGIKRKSGTRHSSYSGLPFTGVNGTNGRKHNRKAG
jgi:hypothetical protein